MKAKLLDNKIEMTHQLNQLNFIAITDIMKQDQCSSKSITL